MSVDCGGDTGRFIRDEIWLEEANSCDEERRHREHAVADRRRRRFAARIATGVSIEDEFSYGGAYKGLVRRCCRVGRGLKHFGKQKETGKVGEVELVHRAQLWSYQGQQSTRNRRKSDRKKGTEEGSAEEIQQEREGNQQRGRHVEERQYGSRRLVYGRQLVQVAEVRWWQEAGHALCLDAGQHRAGQSGTRGVLGTCRQEALVSAGTFGSSRAVQVGGSGGAVCAVGSWPG
ncbi:hypothetical protein C8J57DRAFT_1679007 [Mycena rebaudengoi]|nr:hypothetical protein C8J57DRAFT_1679007 [Mycena rebaudengoi]